MADAQLKEALAQKDWRLALQLIEKKERKKEKKANKEPTSDYLAVSRS